MVYLLHIAGKTEIPEKYKSPFSSSDNCYRGHLRSSSLLESFHPYKWLNTQNKKLITQPNYEQAQSRSQKSFSFCFITILRYYNNALTEISCSSSQSLQANVRTVLQMRLQVLPHLFQFIIH